MNKEIIKKVLTSSILIILFLMKANISNAWVEKKEIKPLMVNVYNFNTGEIKQQPITKMLLFIPTKKVIENPTIVSKLVSEETCITTLDFEKFIEGFFDWLILQQIV